MKDRDPLDDTFREGLGDLNIEPSEGIWSSLEEQLDLRDLNLVFREGLSGMEAAPSDAVWNQIHAGLEEKDLVQTFKNGLGRMEETPSAQVWKGIEAKLSRSRKPAAWWPWMLTAAVIATVSVGLWVWHAQSPADKQFSDRPQSTVPAGAETPRKDQEQPEPAVAAEGRSFTYADNQTNSAIQTYTETPVNSAQRQPGAKAVAGSGETDGNGSEPVFPETVPARDGVSANNGMQPEPKTGAGLLPASASNTKAPDAATSPALKEQMPVITASPAPLELPATAVAEQPEQLSAPRGLEKEQQTGGNKKNQQMRPATGLTLLASPQVGFRTLQSSSDVFQSRSNGSEFAAFSYGFGLRLDREINKYLGIQTGIAYQVHRERFDYNYTVMDREFIPVMDVNGNVVDHFVRDKATPYHTSGISTISSFDVPLQLSARLPLGYRWQVFGAAGPFVSWLYTAEGYTFDPATAQLANQELKGLNRFQYGIAFQAGVQFKLNEYIFFRAEPFYNRNLSDLRTGNYIDKNRLWNSGIQLGVRFRLNKLYKPSDILADNR